MIVTSEMVKGLWVHLEETYGSRRAKKTDPEMALAARFLGDMGILDPDDFLTRYTTTIGRTIYTPYEVGIESNGHKLSSQLIVCVHEHQHVVQYIKEGPKFGFEYLASSARRAAYEANALRCNLEIYYWLYGDVPDVNTLAEGLVHYGCGDGDIRTASKHLSIVAKVVNKGGITSDAGKCAIAWLNTNYPK